jgi:hypothetical protein
MRESEREIYQKAKKHLDEPHVWLVMDILGRDKYLRKGATPAEIFEEWSPPADTPAEILEIWSAPGRPKWSIRTIEKILRDLQELKCVKQIGKGRWALTRLGRKVKHYYR